MHEDVIGAVGVPRDEVRGLRREGNHAGVRADEDAYLGKAVVIRLVAGAVNADPSRLTRLAVVNESVAATVGVAGHKVGGLREEHDVPTVAFSEGLWL